jgi:osmotically-inducible protein OsmY
MKSFKTITVNLLIPFIANTFIISLALAYIPNNDTVKNETSNNSNNILILKSDIQIEREIINSMLEDTSFKGSKIQAISAHGIVTLKGHVSDYALEGRAIAIAEGIDGVKGVASELIVP